MNKSLKTLFLFNGIFVMASNLLGPLYAVYVEGINNSVLAVSSSWSVFLLSTTFFTFIMSKYGDALKEKEYFLIIGYMLRGLVWIGYIFSNSMGILLLLQFILGLGDAMGSPSYDAIFAEHLDNDKHIKEYSQWRLTSNLLSAIATFVGGIIVTAYGFTPLFILMSILAFTSMYGVLATPRDVL